MYGGLFYLFTEKPLREFLRGRRIKKVLPVASDSDPVNILFADGTKLVLKHVPQRVLNDQPAPYWVVELYGSNGMMIRQGELDRLIKGGDA